MEDRELKELWKKVVILSHKSPYCFRSDRYAHLDASREIEKEERLTGQEITQWRKFVDDQTRYMSNYSGD